MSKLQPEKQGGGLRAQAVLVGNVLMAGSSLYRSFMTKAGTEGPREAASISKLWGLGILIVWATLAHSTALLYVGTLIGLGVICERRLKARRGPGVHTFSMGSSVFARRFGERTGRWLEVALALVAGLLLRTEDKGAGAYLMFCGIGHAYTLAFVHAREQAIQDDLNDAQIEGAYRAGRNDDRPLF